MRHWASEAVLAVSLVMGCAGGVGAQVVSQAGPGGMTGDEIAARMLVRNAERQSALEHYVGDRTYRVEYRGTGGSHWGSMAVHVDFANGQKDLTVVSEDGSKFICDKVLRKLVEGEQEASQGANRMQTTLSPDNYDLQLVGEDTINGIPAWVLQVSPKVESKFTYRGRVWVSQEDYAMVRVLGEPAKNPSWWISRASFDWKYQRNGEFWLPESNVAKSHVKIGGDATMTIEYGAYKILSARAVQHRNGETTAAGLRNAGSGVSSRTEVLVSSRIPGQ